MSGTFAYIKEHVIRRKDLGPDEYEKFKASNYADNAKQFENNEQILKFIEENPNAIGYMGMGAAHSSPAVKLLKYAKRKSDEYIEATAQNVYDRKYKLSRALQIVYKNSKSNLLDELVTYITSEQGQLDIQKSGYLRSSLPQVEVTSERKK